MEEFTGGCFCGEVRYALRAPLGAARSCHCSRCRKAFSGAGSAFLPIESAGFDWTRGQSGLRVFESQQGAGIGFCGRCGSTLCGLHEGRVVGVTLGTLDGDPPVEIGEHIFVGSKAGWDHIGGPAPQFETRPLPPSTRDREPPS